jgi:hypothetical protein
MFAGLFLGWGNVAFVIAFIPGVPAAFAYLHFSLWRGAKDPRMWFEWVIENLGRAVMMAALGAAVVWMIVDSVQATWNWLNDPRGRAIPWRNWWAGPIRAVLFVGALIGLGIAFFVPIPRSNEVDLVCLIGVFGFFAACIVTFLVRLA